MMRRDTTIQGKTEDSRHPLLLSPLQPAPLWRIDVVAVELDRSGKPSRIKLIENAIDED